MIEVPGGSRTLFAALLSLSGLSACDSEARRPSQESGSGMGENSEVSPVVTRGLALELDTPYELPPGEALHHHTAGFANTLCSAVFLTGLDPRDTAENVGGFSAPFEHRHHVVDTIVDLEQQWTPSSTSNNRW